ncbi:hypothetical protein Tco_0611178 [Tanacetum coccineum]
MVTTLDGDTIVDAQTQDRTDQLQASSGMSEHNSILHNVEVLSEGSNENEATLGERLQNLDVEIGSANGHYDSDVRQGPVDYQTVKTNVSLGNTTSISGIEASLHSVTKASSRSFNATAGKCSTDVHLREVTLKEELL